MAQLIPRPVAEAEGISGFVKECRRKKPSPEGFEYVLMGIIAAPANVALESVEGKIGMGTPPPNAEIAAAPGAAVTTILEPEAAGKLEALVTMATSMDGPDQLALAKGRLDQAESAGFDGVVQENTAWWNHVYDRRENGRVFYGAIGSSCSDDVKAIYRSYADSHGGGTKTDMRQLECSASYAFPERDIQLWTSAPCYNESFYTNRFVRNWGDSEDMWKRIIRHWMDAAEENAGHMFNLPGMYIMPGYLPPIKANKYVHTTFTLEFCMDTMAQLSKPSWDEWDYDGDIRVSARGVLSRYCERWHGSTQLMLANPMIAITTSSLAWRLKSGSLSEVLAQQRHNQLLMHVPMGIDQSGGRSGSA
jgi:hypothetical protein